jgi:hypothetical protein
VLFHDASSAALATEQNASAWVFSPEGGEGLSTGTPSQHPCNGRLDGVAARSPQPVRTRPSSGLSGCNCRRRALVGRAYNEPRLIGVPARCVARSATVAPTRLRLHRRSPRRCDQPHRVPLADKRNASKAAKRIDENKQGSCWRRALAFGTQIANISMSPAPCGEASCPRNP